MDYILNLLDFENIALVVVGIIGIVAFMMIMRIMRKGRLSYDSRHEAIDNRIKETAQNIRENNNAMQSHEQLHIIAAALKDALELKGHNAQELITEYTDHIEIALPAGLISVHYMQKAKTLRSTKKTIYGQGLWEVTQAGNTQTFNGLIQLERHLQKVLLAVEDATN